MENIVCLEKWKNISKELIAKAYIQYANKSIRISKIIAKS
jgi:hypothetical protein